MKGGNIMSNLHLSSKYVQKPIIQDNFNFYDEMKIIDQKRAEFAKQTRFNENNSKREEKLIQGLIGDLYENQ